MASATHTQQTYFRNVSGATRYYAYIGLHGTLLTAGQDVAVDGTVWSIHGRQPILMQSFENDLKNGLIEVLKTPDVLCYDTVLQKVLQLGISNGAPVAVAMDYGSYAGSPPVVS